MTRIAVSRGSGARVRPRPMWLLLSSTAALSCGLLAPALAADGDASVGLEEVIVTARKQAENLQDVPITVTALTSKAIEQLGIRSVYDLAAATPGVYYTTVSGRNGQNKLQIRNFSTGTVGPSKASVFIDGVFSFQDYSSIPLANLERIEVLKGPQSAYFGRSTFVGAVNFVTRDPGNEFSGKLDFVGATEGEHDVTGYVSFPIINDKLSQQFTFRHYNFDGPDEWVTNDGLHLGGMTTKAISSKTMFKPTEDIKVSFNFTYVNDDDEHPAVIYDDPRLRTPIARPGGTFGYYRNGPVDIHFAAPAWGISTANIPDPGIRHDLYRMNLNYEAKVLGQTVSGFLAHNREWFNEQFDGFLFLGGQSPYVVPNAQGVLTTSAFTGRPLIYDIRDEDDQAEFRIRSPNDWRLRYMVGYNYTNIDGHVQTFPLTPFNNPSNSNGAGGNFLNPSKTNSVFGGLYYDVTDRVTLSGEGRYQKDRINSKNYSTAAATYGALVSNVSANYYAFLPRVNLQYKLSPGTQFYAVYAEGNNPGGFQGVTPALLVPLGIAYAYDEETIKNYEIGFKSSWLENRLTVNAAIFHMDFDKEQLSQSTVVPGAPGGLASIYQPGVASKVDGFEIEANAVANQFVTLRATVGYGKAKYKSFCSSPYGGLTGIYDTPLAPCRNVAGLQHEGTPALQTSLGADYAHPLSLNMLSGDWSFYARGDWQYQSKIYNEEWNQSWVSGHGLANARIGIENANWTFEGFVRNITDFEMARGTRITDSNRLAAIGGSYPNFVSPTTSASQALGGYQNVAGQPRKPRQFGLRLAYQF